MGQPKKQSTAPKSSTIESKADSTGLNDPDTFAQSLKPVIMEAIQDVLDELETVDDNVSKGAKDHIHSEYAIDSAQLTFLSLTCSPLTAKSSSPLVNPEPWKPIWKPRRIIETLLS